MDFNYQPQQHVGIFTLSGNLIGEHDGMPLTDAFNEQMEMGVRHFVVDLTELKHINSSGLGVLITLLTKARKKDGELFLVNPSPYIRNLMLITKLNSIFQTFPTIAEAVEKAGLK
jgi:anti-sigma B factor antagonist